jgi:hypothetical protein
MDDSQISRTREQLQFVKDILVRTVGSNDVSVNRERVTVAIERIALIEGLLSEVWQEVDRIRTQDYEIRRAHNVELASQKERLQKREAENVPSKNYVRADSTVRSERQFFPDQGVIDSYSDLVRKYGEINRGIQLMRADVESAIRNIDDFWTGDDESKRFVVEKLKTAVSIK